MDTINKHTPPSVMPQKEKVQKSTPPSEQTTKKRKTEDNVDTLWSTEQGNSPTTDKSAARFFIIEPSGPQTLHKLSPFAIEKFLKCRIGSVRSAKKLQSGSLLVEVSTPAQADNIVQMDMFAETPVKVSAHRTLNSSRGIIRCRDLRDCDDEEVLTELKPTGVTAVKHIFATRDGMKTPTNTFIVTFGTPELPSHIKIGYLRVPVERYIPNPLRCFKCQRYGHGKAMCKRTLTCARCGQEGHDDETCSLPHHCFNCSGDHPAYSRQCPYWKRQLEITRVKLEKNVSFREAEELVRRRDPATSNPPTGPSYATVTTPPHRAQLISEGTQTDLTWPHDSKIPISLSVACQTDSSLSAEVRPSAGTAALSNPPPCGGGTATAAGGGSHLPIPTASASVAANHPDQGSSRPGPASSKGNSVRLITAKPQQQQQQQRQQQQSKGNKDPPKPQQQQQPKTQKVVLNRPETFNSYSVLAEGETEGMEEDIPLPDTKKS